MMGRHLPDSHHRFSIYTQKMITINVKFEGQSVHGTIVIVW